MEESLTGLLGYPAAADYLDDSERHLRRLVAERKIAFVKVGRKVRFRKSDLDAFVTANVVEAAR